MKQYSIALVLVFISTHIIYFLAKLLFDEKMPLMTQYIETGPGIKSDYYVGTTIGQYYPVDQVKLPSDKENIPGVSPKQLEIRNRTDVYNVQAKVKVGELYKDLHKLTFDFFKNPQTSFHPWPAIRMNG